MRSRFFVFSCLLVLCTNAALAAETSATHANAAASPSQARPSPFMRINGPTLPPFGFVRFCETHPQECVAGPVEEARFNADADRIVELDRINRQVNKAIAPATDMELYGEVERWTLPVNGKGDCEDYALLKRHMLIKRGWPASALLMTVVRDEKNEGHAVLTARTAQGDFILDNKVDDVRPWYKVQYAFVMRQSYLDPRFWVALGPKDAPTPALLAGVRSTDK